jgi:hypothetical protein
MGSPFEQQNQEQELGEGARILHDLERTGEYVFHGSPDPSISELEPRQPYDWTDGIEKEDGTPCVAATQFADIAIFRAIVHDDSTSFGQNDNRTLHFAATQKALDTAMKTIGFVYVLKKSAFIPRHGDDQEMEWRSDVRQKALQIIPVTVRDLPKNITIIPPEDSDTTEA